MLRRVFLFGAESDDKSTVYAKHGDRDLVFAVRKAVTDALAQADLVDPTVFTLDLSKVRGMKITRRDTNGATSEVYPKMNDPVERDDVIYVKESLF